MLISTSAKILERPPHLWGVENVITWIEDMPRQGPPMFPREQRWARTSAWLEPSPLEHLFSASSSLTEEITEMFRRVMELKIHVPAPNDVWQYLEAHPDLIRMVMDLAVLARARLPDAVLSLEISQDPEEEHEYAVIYARFYDYDQTTMEKIRAVRKEFLSLLSNEREWPLLTTDFRSP